MPQAAGKKITFKIEILHVVVKKVWYDLPRIASKSSTKSTSAAVDVKF